MCRYCLGAGRVWEDTQIALPQRFEFLLSHRTWSSVSVPDLGTAGARSFQRSEARKEHKSHSAIAAKHSQHDYVASGGQETSLNRLNAPPPPSEGTQRDLDTAQELMSNSCTLEVH